MHLAGAPQVVSKDPPPPESAQKPPCRRMDASPPLVSRFSAPLSEPLQLSALQLSALLLSALLLLNQSACAC